MHTDDESRQRLRVERRFRSESRKKQTPKQRQLQSPSEEDEARGVSRARIQEYWTKTTRESTAARAHQEDLSHDEVILRRSKSGLL